jgi:hypothetical protein
MKKYLFLFLFGSALLLIPDQGFSQAIAGTYAIKNVQTGKLLRPQEASKRDGAPIVLYNPVNWKCVTWDFKSVGPNTYQLENLFTSKTLQPVGQSPTEKVSLHQQPLSEGQTHQQWEFVPVATDVYLIKLKGTDLYLTPSDQEGAANSGVELEKKKEGPLQQWTIYEQHPTM